MRCVIGVVCVVYEHCVFEVFQCMRNVLGVRWIIKSESCMDKFVVVVLGLWLNSSSQSIVSINAYPTTLYEKKKKKKKI